MLESNNTGISEEENLLRILQLYSWIEKHRWK